MAQHSAIRHVPLLSLVLVAALAAGCQHTMRTADGDGSTAKSGNAASTTTGAPGTANTGLGSSAGSSGMGAAGTPLGTPSGASSPGSSGSGSSPSQ